MENKEQDWLSVICNLLECWCVMEGTWYEEEWSKFGITQDQHATILKHMESRKYNFKSDKAMPVES